MKKKYLIGLLFISFLFFDSIVCQQSASDDFSEFDDLDEPEIKIDNPELSLKTDEQIEAAVDSRRHDDNEFKNLESDEDEEVTVEEEIAESNDDQPPKDEKEKKPFEPMKLSSLPLHLR